MSDSRIPDRLPRLSKGSHPPTSGRACAMEAASWLAGEPWSDHPRSVHPVIAGVARWVNDSVSNDERQQLWPLILASLDTARPHNVVLTYRLRRRAWKVRTRIPVDARSVWRSVLTLHAELTGHRSRSVPAERIGDLADHLSAPSGD